MYVLNCNIEINGKRFTRVSEVKIESSAKLLEDTATVKIPTTARLERQGEFISEVETAKQFKVGDPVRIELGYDGNVYEVFEGYVMKIAPGVPLEIQCIDATWLLRRKNCKKSFQSTTLKNLLEFILDGTGITLKGEVPGINLAPYYLKNISAASALQKIKERYGLTLYLKDMQLHVGLASYTDDVIVKYELGTNIIDNDLTWVNEDDTRIKIKAILIKKDNTKIEKEVGDGDGETRTLYFYNLDSAANLETLALQEIKKYKYAGYKGGINTFLIPGVRVGNVARMADPQFSERSGDYIVDKVTTTFGQNGARRKVELGLKVTTNG